MPTVNIKGVGVVNFPDSMQPADIKTAASRIAAAHADSTSTAAPSQPDTGAAPAAVAAPSDRWAPDDWRRRMMDTIPYVGAGVGGGLGTAAGAAAGGIGAIPGAVTGAAAGGSGGSIIEHLLLQAMQQETPDAGATAMSALKSGGQGALDELFGQGLTHGTQGLMQAVAEPLYAKALTISPLIAGGRSSEQVARELAKTALEERVPIGGINKLGSKTALERVKGSGQELRKIFIAANKAGVTIDPHDIAEPVADLIGEINNQPLARADRRAVKTMTKQFLEEHPGPMTMLKTKLLKRRAQSMAKRLIQGRAAGNAPGPTGIISSADFNDAIATGAKRSLENVTTSLPKSMRSPGIGSPQTFGEAVAAREGKTSRLIDLYKTIKKSESATSKVPIKPFGGFRPAGASTPDFALTRPEASRIALGLTDPRIGAAVKQTPRLIDLLLHQAIMGDATPDQGAGQ